MFDNESFDFISRVIIEELEKFCTVDFDFNCEEKVPVKI